MNLKKKINNIKSSIERGKHSRNKIELGIYNLERKVNKLESEYEILKRDSQLVVSEDSINRICNSIETERESDNFNNNDSKFKRWELVIAIIGLLISAAAFFSSTYTAYNQSEMEKLLERVVISCEYSREESNLLVRKENGIYEHVSIYYSPFFSTSFAIETEDGNVQIPKEPILISINKDWQKENANPSSMTILKRDINEWNDQYSPILQTITEYYNGQVSSYIQLGYIIKVEYFDAINKEQCAKYYKLLTDVFAESKAQVSIEAINRYDTYEIKEIDAEEAARIFYNKCELSILNERTWAIDFWEKYQGK